MAKKHPESPFQALEQEAYQAYREWPIWLVLRRRQLETHLEQVEPPKHQTAVEAAPTKRKDRR
jgi:hypothetical protein